MAMPQRSRTPSAWCRLRVQQKPGLRKPGDRMQVADAEMRSAVEDSPSSAAAAQAQDVEAATAEPTATVQVLPSVAGGEGAPAAEADGAQATAKSVEMLCLRCAKLPPNCVFLPCAHKVWCVECAAELPPTCPICNTGISQSLRTFHKRLG